MSKKHFIKAAALICAIQHPEARRQAARVIAILATGDNPRFDLERFAAACNVPAAQIREV